MYSPFVRSCHFYGGLDKFLWLYLPVLILLIINSAMFVYIAYDLAQNRKDDQSLG